MNGIELKNIFFDEQPKIVGPQK